MHWWRPWPAKEAACLWWLDRTLHSNGINRRMTSSTKLIFHLFVPGTTKHPSKTSKWQTNVKKWQTSIHQKHDKHPTITDKLSLTNIHPSKMTNIHQTNIKTSIPGPTKHPGDDSHPMMTSSTKLIFRLFIPGRFILLCLTSLYVFLSLGDIHPLWPPSSRTQAKSKIPALSVASKCTLAGRRFSGCCSY